MNFWTKFCCSLLILNYVEMKNPKEYEFHTMPLGHTGLLIFWDPQGVSDSRFLHLKYHAVGKMSTANISEIVLAEDGQHKLNSSLIENTDYEITITTNGPNEAKIIKAKTGLKKNSVPEKPDFTWSLNIDNPNYELKIRITWIPCGKQRNCHGNEPGTHFAVRYKILDMRETFTVVQNGTDYVDLPYIYIGHIYEAIVSSINGDFQTDSDSQEIFHVPTSSPVHSVKALTLSNTSLYISWEKPRQSIGAVFQYHLHITTEVDSSYPFQSEFYNSRFEQIIRKRVNGLIPNTHFTISIIPYVNAMPGFAYTFDYLIPAVQAINLTLAKPGFKFIDAGFCVFALPGCLLATVVRKSEINH